MAKKIRNILEFKDLNQVFLVGEVVDLGISPRKTGIVARTRLKIRTSNSFNTFVYLDVYGKKNVSETMNLICQTGNIVYLEGEFRNTSLDKINIKPYVLVRHIECLRRQKRVAPPNTSVVAVLDELDPMKYYETKRKRKKKKDADIQENES